MVFDVSLYVVFFFKQKTAYEMRISDWSSDVCSSDLAPTPAYCRLYFDEDERQAVRVFYEGVLPDGETVIGGKLTDELLAQAHTWQGHADYLDQTPYIVSGNQGWDEIVNVALHDKAGYQDRP